MALIYVSCAARPRPYLCDKTIHLINIQKTAFRTHDLPLCIIYQTVRRHIKMDLFPRFSSILFDISAEMSDKPSI